jgi:hypothetical protein
MEPRRSRPPILKLCPPPSLPDSDDVLGIINRFVGHHNLAETSANLSRLFLYFNRRYSVTDANVERILEAISQPMVSLEGTSFTIRDFRPTGRIKSFLPDLYAYMPALSISGEAGYIGHALSGLEGAHNLHTLHVKVDMGCFRGRVSRLSVLANAPSVHTLTLDLAEADIDDEWVQYLVMYLANRGTAPPLRCLNLRLSGTRIGDDATRALSGLDMQNMHTLKLDLSDTRVTPDAARVLGALKGAPVLHTLHISLRSNALGSDGILGLVALKGSQTLHTLSLSLGLNDIGDAGVLALCELKAVPFLKDLELFLGDNFQISNDGARYLAELRHAPYLRRLVLDLSTSSIGALGAVHLATLGTAPALKTLTMNIRDNRIGDAGARALAILKEAPRLERLHLGINKNNITDRGASALLRLQNCNDMQRDGRPTSLPRLHVTFVGGTPL